MAPSRSAIFADSQSFQIFAADLSGRACIILQTLLATLHRYDNLVNGLVLRQCA